MTGGGGVGIFDYTKLKLIMQTLVGEYYADRIILLEYPFPSKLNRERFHRTNAFNAVIRSMRKLPKFNFFLETVKLNIWAKNNFEKSVQFQRVARALSILPLKFQVSFSPIAVNRCSSPKCSFLLSLAEC